MLRKSYVVCFFVMQLLCCSLFLYADGYKIVGNVPAVEDGTLLYLRIVGPPSKNIDSVYVKNGHFEFVGDPVEKPLWALIAVKGRFLCLCDFYLENGVIDVKGETSYKAIASGTKTNEEYNVYQRMMSFYNDSLYQINVRRCMLEDQNSVEMENLTREFNLCQSELEKQEMEFIKTYPASPISLRLISYRSTKVSSRKIKEMISCLDAKMLQEPEIVHLEKYAERLSRTEAGVVAPDFTLKTLNGKEFILSKERGNYLLLDFWASWCAPCRASFPLIAEIHKRYGGKNFRVIGISLDKDLKAWEKALEEEKCTWVQVCDSKGSVAEQYAISSIPTLLLMGPDGKIIGRFTKDEIMEKLEELLVR